MPKCPQDIYARHLITASRHGYPLWTPTPSREFLAYRRDGLRIGDVGVVIPEDGCFDVFFNITLPRDHPFHRSTGVPDNFEPINLRDTDIRTDASAENAGSVIAASSVKTVRTSGGHRDASSRAQSGLECEFNLSSSEGALLILPDGAERRDLRNHQRFLEVAARHGADWYRFVEEKVGQIIGNDSLYLITGLCKTRSWSVAAFEKTSGSGEYPAECKLARVGDGIAATYTWDTTRALDWRVGPIDNYGESNQTVFIRGFKIAIRSGMFKFGPKRIYVKADERPNPIRFFGTVPAMSRTAILGSQTGQGSSTRNEMATDSAINEARNEIENSEALVVGEHVMIQRIPEGSQAFHPSDAINQCLLNKESSVDIAIVHDDDWTALLDEGLVQPGDLLREGLLETLMQKYRIETEAGAVYLRSWNNDSEVPKVNMVNATTEGYEMDVESSALIADDAPSMSVQGDNKLGPSGEDASNLMPRSSTASKLLVLRDDIVFSSDDSSVFSSDNSSIFSSEDYSAFSSDDSSEPYTPPQNNYALLPDGPVAIHPLLAFHPFVPPIVYDISLPPTTLAPNVHASLSLPARVLDEPATQPSVHTMTLFIEQFPWRLVIPPTKHFVSVRDCVEALYTFLRHPVLPSEYNALPTQALKDGVSVAFHNRCGRAQTKEAADEQYQKGVKRVDFLRGRTRFMGLSSTKVGPDVWVLNLG